MRPLRVIGLDLSLRATGLAATHTSSGERRLFAETIATDRSAHSPTIIDHARLHRIFTRVARATECRPDLVVIEKPLLIDLGDASIRLAELHGAIKHWLYAKGIRYVDVDPGHLKQYATDSGGAKKFEVLAATIARYGRLLHISDDNQADALTLLAMALDAYGDPLAEVSDSHRRSLFKTNWPSMDRTGADR